MKLSDFATLALAQAHTVTQPKLIHRDTMNSLLANAGIYAAFKVMALDDANPFQDNIAAFLDSTDYNFMVGDGTTTGDRQIAALDTMIASGGAMGAALSAIRPIILAIANPVVYPCANVTLHAFELAKDTVTRIPLVANEQGYARITTTSDCPLHNPQITRLTTLLDGTLIYTRVASFMNVSQAKPNMTSPYLAICPAGDYFVDNTYGVIS